MASPPQHPVCPPQTSTRLPAGLILLLGTAARPGDATSGPLVYPADPTEPPPVPWESPARPGTATLSGGNLPHSPRTSALIHRNLPFSQGNPPSQRGINLRPMQMSPEAARCDLPGRGIPEISPRFPLWRPFPSPFFGKFCRFCPCSTGATSPSSPSSPNPAHTQPHKNPPAGPAAPTAAPGGSFGIHTAEHPRSRRPGHTRAPLAPDTRPQNPANHPTKNPGPPSRGPGFYCLDGCYLGGRVMAGTVRERSFILGQARLLAPQRSFPLGEPEFQFLERGDLCLIQFHGCRLLLHRNNLPTKAATSQALEGSGMT